MMEVVVTTGAIRCAKLQPNCHYQHNKSTWIPCPCWKNIH